jgi:hypothetical protein
MTIKSKQPRAIYLSYAQEDEVLKQDFENNVLIMLQQTQLISWIERQVHRGTDWSQVIDSRLFVTDLAILLVSPNLLSSSYCSGAEFHKMFEQFKEGKMRIIPILLHPVNLLGSPLSSIMPLPMNRVPISSWKNQREAWENVDQWIRAVLDQGFRFGII